MKSISIDIETFSSVSLQKSGVYRYAESDDFEILLFGYSVDGGEVKVVDLAMGEKIPEEIIDALTDDKVIKWAFNAQFERVCLSRYLRDNGVSLGGYCLDPESWHCTMIWAATLGLPLSLEGVGAVLGLEKQKLTEGKNLIKYFCVPCSPTKVNGGRTRNMPYHDLEKWSQFKAYLYAQLEEADRIYDDRMRSWEVYRRCLEDLEKSGYIQLPVIPEGCRHNAHMFYIKCSDIEERSSLINCLKEQGIASAFHYIPLHGSPAGKKYGRFSGEDRYTTSESQRLLRLPMYYGLSEDDIIRTCEVISGSYKR